MSESDATATLATSDEYFVSNQTHVVKELSPSTSSNKSKAPLLSLFEQLLLSHSHDLQVLFETKRTCASSQSLSTHFAKKSTRFTALGPTANHQLWMASASEKDAIVKFGQQLKKYHLDSGSTPKAFLDLGAAPGGWSHWLLGSYSSIRGIGVDLPRREGGREVKMDGWKKDEGDRYRFVERDLLNAHKDTVALGGRLPGSIDIALAGAIPNEVLHDSPAGKALGTSPAALLLTLNQLYLAFLYLKPGGSLIANMPKRGLLINCEMLLLLRATFKELIPFAPIEAYAHKSVYQLLGLGFEEEKRKDGLDRIKEAIIKLEGVSEDHLAKDNGVLLFVEKSETSLFEQHKDFLLAFFTPLWQFQTEAILNKQKRLDKRYGDRSADTPLTRERSVHQDDL